MYLLTERGAIVFGLASGAAVSAVALVLNEGRSWPAAILVGAGAFIVTATFMNSVIS